MAIACHSKKTLNLDMPSNPLDLMYVKDLSEIFVKIINSDIRLKNRDTRLSMTVHAEMNCVAFAARNGVCLAGATMYVWPLMTCSQCASVLIQADIASIVVPDFVEPFRWQESFDKAREMCVEAGIAVHRIPMEGSIDGTEEELAVQ